MTLEVILTLLFLFTITSFTNILTTLKTIFLSKKIMNPVYILVFIDAIIFATVLTKITNSNSVHFIIAYAFGRMFGVFIGGKIEERLALGIIEIDLFLNNKNKMIEVAERLRQEGYTVNNFVARGMNGDVRHKIEIVMKRKEFKVLERILDEYGVTNPTLKIKNLSKIEGKITTTNVHVQ